MSKNRIELYGLILFMGLICSIMTYFNGVLAKFTGLYLGGLLVHLIGLGPALLLFLIFDWNKRELWKESFQKRKYIFAAGFIGSIMLIMSAYCINSAGVFITSIAMTVGQFILSLIIDLKGWFGFEKIKLNTTKVMAIVVIAVGSVMISI